MVPYARARGGLYCFCYYSLLPTQFVVEQPPAGSKLSTARKGTIMNIHVKK